MAIPETTCASTPAWALAPAFFIDEALHWADGVWQHFLSAGDWAGQHLDPNLVQEVFTAVAA